MARNSGQRVHPARFSSQPRRGGLPVIPGPHGDPLRCRAWDVNQLGEELGVEVGYAGQVSADLEELLKTWRFDEQVLSHGLLTSPGYGPGVTS
jgi:hypothetical protein